MKEAQSDVRGMKYEENTYLLLPTFYFFLSPVVYKNLRKRSFSWVIRQW